MFDAIVNRRIDLRGLEFDVEYWDIEELNRLALDAENDITKCSTALMPAIVGEYALLDSGSALGRGNGPLLVRRKGETTSLRRVAVPGEHTTANALVKRLFPEIEERVPMLFSDIAEAVERGDYDAGVLIHEGRFVYHRRNLELVADLGLEWEGRMQLPLPLGSIVARRSLGAETVALVEEVLRESIAYAFAHPEVSREFIKAHAQEMEDDVIDRHIALFVNDFSLSLGAEGRRAVERLTGVDNC
jgi:1,4-dihydroxy-6-naphthoate synthase